MADPDPDNNPSPDPVRDPDADPVPDPDTDPGGDAVEMLDLNVIEGGVPDGEPMVLLHGFLSSRHQWDLNIAGLGERFRTIIVELPGHGESPGGDHEANFSRPVLLSALDRIRERLAVDRWWVVGHSMGGAIGIRYALAYPARVRGVAFTNSRAAFGISRTAQAREAGQLHPTSVAEMRELPFHPIHAKRFPDEIKQRMVRAADAMNPATVTTVAANADTWRSREDLAQLDVPVLLVNGVWESAFQPFVAEAVEAIADLRLVELEGGHSINVEQPDLFDQAVIEFIDDCRRTQARAAAAE